MSYNFETCFWDKDDGGVNILLSHISAGIKSCDTMVHFFRQKCETEKDYTRRLGAINEKFSKDQIANPEFGNLSNLMDTLLEVEKVKAQAHAKQSEIIFRQVYSDVKVFAAELQARYTTVSGKIESLRLDKYNKKMGCGDLAKRLEKAEIRVRDLQLNQNNIIGSKRVEQNQRDLAKWESNKREFQNQLNILKQEYKASQKYWIQEWGELTIELQRMETARISFLQAKMQQYLQASMETCILEQSKMDLMISRLSGFTPSDDISKFSSEYGTGRLKKEKRNRKSFNTDFDKSQNSYSVGGLESVNSKRHSYIDNVRMFSSQLKQNSSITSDEINRKPRPVSVIDKIRLQKELPHPNITHSIPNDEHISEIYEPSNVSAPQTISDPYENDDSQAYPFPQVRKREATTKQDNSYYSEDKNDTVKTNIYSPRSTQATKQPASFGSDSSPSEYSSNSTDFTTHVKNRQSIDSMTTSVSSLASSIDDSQRFVKSWNSANRKRKSMSHIQLSSSQMENEEESRTGMMQNINNTEKDTQRNERPSMARAGSTGTIRRNHRSENLEKDSRHDLEIPNNTQKKVSVSGKRLPGKVLDNGIMVTLPIKTKNGETVIHYAKALFPLLETNAPGVAHFDQDDYVLITEVINDNWYRGEIYDNDRIAPEYSMGLIPFNFIEILS
ncbi:hypothetical protein NCAS_0A12870 [Naumovozyma castellii]|uniref:F-BAR domain-containing protein n=1 Tax=Naumovozyma castellii TaxID=27288 RepID=G0V8P6_NAUCA|nr:hypothetical protein NCAS_0A12870 [Naumovozyma castellii CBS 4309]CCC67845.1 hypothetical protein NCAS_0A12870 [Naumovozyma castellii CBS 4309]